MERTFAEQQSIMAYPVAVNVDIQLTGRNRLTAGLRPLLVLPHAILVGPITKVGAAGLLGAAAYVMAVVSWFTLLINGTQFEGIRQFIRFYLGWRARALAYMALFVDPYPPFGDGTYPATIAIEEPVVRDRVSIAVRLILALPHVILLGFLLIGWFVTTIVAWFTIVFTGEYPSSLATFSVGVMRWLIRVEAYLLLLVDEYPPFALD